MDKVIFLVPKYSSLLYMNECNVHPPVLMCILKFAWVYNCTHFRFLDYLAALMICSTFKNIYILLYCC